MGLFSFITGIPGAVRSSTHENQYDGNGSAGKDDGEALLNQYDDDDQDEASDHVQIRRWVNEYLTKKNIAWGLHNTYTIGYYSVYNAALLTTLLSRFNDFYMPDADPAEREQGLRMATYVVGAISLVSVALALSANKAMAKRSWRRSQADFQNLERLRDAGLLTIEQIEAAKAKRCSFDKDNSTFENILTVVNWPTEQFMKKYRLPLSVFLRAPMMVYFGRGANWWPEHQKETMVGLLVASLGLVVVEAFCDYFADSAKSDVKKVHSALEKIAHNQGHVFDPALAKKLLADQVFSSSIKENRGFHAIKYLSMGTVVSQIIRFYGLPMSIFGNLSLLVPDLFNDDWIMPLVFGSIGLGLGVGLNEFKNKFGLIKSGPKNTFTSIADRVIAIKTRIAMAKLFVINNLSSDGKLLEQLNQCENDISKLENFANVFLQFSKQESWAGHAFAFFKWFSTGTRAAGRSETILHFFSKYFPAFIMPLFGDKEIPLTLIVYLSMLVVGTILFFAEERVDMCIDVYTYGYDTKEAVAREQQKPTHAQDFVGEGVVDIESGLATQRIQSAHNTQNSARIKGLNEISTDLAIISKQIFDKVNDGEYSSSLQYAAGSVIPFEKIFAPSFMQKLSEPPRKTSARKGDKIPEREGSARASPRPSPLPPESEEHRRSMVPGLGGGQQRE